MSGVDLEAIRLRVDNDDCDGYHGSGSCEICDAAWADRHTLLEEVDRLRGLLATLRADTRHGCSTPCCGCAASIAHAVRAAEPTP